MTLQSTRFVVIAARRAASPLLGATCLFLLAGCTAGVAVDENFRPFAPSSPLTWVAVDPSTGTPTGKTYEANGAGTPYFSYDPLAPTSTNVNGTGIPNVSEQIPAGYYYVGYFLPPILPAPNTLRSIASPIFYHSYYTTCTDEFTGKQDAYCAPYYFEQIFNCESWQCVNGSTNANPPGNLHGGIRVIPMIASDETYLDLYPSAAPGTLQW
jgi:hypothetical protein